MYDVTIIGAGILDVLARPVDASVFKTGSQPAQDIALTFGGDALNEAVILSRLGKKVQFISTLGTDEAGSMVLEYCERNGIPTDHITRSPDFPTGINLVLVNRDGERSFVTNPSGSLRMLSPSHIDAGILKNAPILCFASIFVFPKFNSSELTKLFKTAKESGCLVCADMTKRKNQETLSDLSQPLSYVDYIFPNYEEACLVSGQTDPDEIAEAFLACGVRHFVMKLGKRGCLIRTKAERHLIPAFPDADCVDTTGAGDTFAAGFLYALSEGMNLPACGCFANAAASITIEGIGAATQIHSFEQVQKRFQTLLSLAQIDSL